MITKMVSALINNPNVILDVNNTAIPNIQALTFQVSGTLKYNNDSGMQYNDDLLEKKANSFIKLAQETNASLVLTPEGSIKNSIIKEIINDKLRWPRLGKLWCLCSTGISYCDFTILYEELEYNHNIEVYCSGRDSDKNYVNSLWYLFRISDEKLCVIVQLKMASSRDISFEYESCGMSVGNTFFVFDLGKDGEISQLFASLICSDAIGASCLDIAIVARRLSLLLFNPQMNPKPRNRAFQNFRTRLLTETSIKNKRIISLNWGENTSITGTKEKISDGTGSMIMTDRNCDTSNVHLNEIVEARRHNRSKGLSLFYDEDRNICIWRINNIESVQLILLKNFNAVGTFYFLHCNKDVYCQNVYLFDCSAQIWKDADKSICDTSFEKAVYDSTKYSLPYKCQQNVENCCNIEGCCLIYIDFFFALCFGDIEKDQLKMNSEVGNKITNAYDSDSRKNQENLLRLFKILVNLLESNVFPMSLLYLYEDNTKFAIDPNAVETGSNRIFNLVPIVPKDRLSEKKAVVSIVDSSDILEVHKIYEKIRKATFGEYKDQIIIYYKDSDTGIFSPYLDPFMQKNINDSHMTSNPTSYRK